MRNTFRIPFVQPLSPLEIFRTAGDLKRTFPFSAPALRYYYLARNAIWHGADSLGLRAGDGVLMPAYHHGVESEVLKEKRLKLVFYRIDENMRIDLRHVESVMTPDVRALYVIHYLGFPQAIDAIRSFVRDRGLLLIEDCALSLFSAAPQGPLGSFGDIGIFCLYKTLPLPHGGTLVVNRTGAPLPPEPRPGDWVSTFIYAANRSIDYFDLHWNGVGHRLADLGRGLGRMGKRTLQVEPVPIDTNDLDLSVLDLGMSPGARHLLDRTRVQAVVANRRRNYELLRSRLDPAVRRILPALPEGVCPLSLPILAPDKERVYRELLADGVETVNFWSRSRPEVRPGEFPEVEFLRQHVLEIPIHQGLKADHIEFIAGRVNARAAW